MRYIKASGSFEDVGYQVGQVCAADIEEVYERGLEYLIKFTKAQSFDQLHQMAARYLAAAASAWKPAIDFLWGMAGGAGVDMRVIALTAFTEEVSTEIGLKPADKCSTWVGRIWNGKIIKIHSEDFEEQNLGKMVLLQLKFLEFPEAVCLAYPGQLWGSGFSFNARRISITKNGLHLPAVPGLPTQLVQSRAALACTLPEATGWVMMPPVSAPAQYIFVSGETGEAVSLLVSNLKASYTETKLHHIKDRFFFTNHIPDGWLKLKEPDPAPENSPSTLPRYEKLKNLLPAEWPQTPAEAFELFTKPPIFLKPGKPGASVTMVTTVICPENGWMRIRDADPSAARRDWNFFLHNGEFILGE